MFLPKKNCQAKAVGTSDKIDCTEKLTLTKSQEKMYCFAEINEIQHYNKIVQSKHFLLTLFMQVKNGPNKTSFATASKTRLPPIMLFRLALRRISSTYILAVVYIKPKYWAKAEGFYYLFGLQLRPPKFYSKYSAFCFFLKIYMFRSLKEDRIM